MVGLKWSEAMSVEVEELDEDHRIAIATLSELGERLARRDGEGAVRVSDEMLRITRIHFAREERMLAECGFPLLAQHVKGHREAEEQLLALDGTLRRQDWAAAEAGHAAACEMFLFRLILEDLDYKLFLHDRGLIPRFEGLGVAEWRPREHGSAAKAHSHRP